MSKIREVIGTIYYDEDSEFFTAVLNFEDGRRLSGMGRDVTEVITVVVSDIQSRFRPDCVNVIGEMYERHQESGRDRDFNLPISDDFEPEELENLLVQFQISAKVPNEEISRWDRLYLKAFNFMAKKHYGQKDKAGMDYYFHPTRVSKILDPKASLIGVLHDMLEDTDATAKKLKALGCPKDVVDAVLALTRKEGESYRDYILRVDKNELARDIKFIDLEDNMDLTRLTEVTEKDLKRLNKYLHEWRYLHGHDAELNLLTD